MRLSKRIFDLFFAIILLCVLSPVILVISLLVAVRDGFPVFFLSKRMRTVEREFTLIKFRTMSGRDDGKGVSGSDKLHRITPLGAWLRASRLDELPQLVNIAKGDMSFVGPRPPLRRYVEAEPELYREVLKARPGITGLATLKYHAHEARILAQCVTNEQTHEVYLRRCVPSKARLDMIYVKNWSMCWDLEIIISTIAVVWSKLVKR